MDDDRAFQAAVQRWADHQDPAGLIEYLGSDRSLSPSQRRGIASAMEMMRIRAEPRARGQRGANKEMTPVRRAANVVKIYRDAYERHTGHAMPAQERASLIEFVVNEINQNFGKNVAHDEVKAYLAKGRGSPG